MSLLQGTEHTDATAPLKTAPLETQVRSIGRSLARFVVGHAADVIAISTLIGLTGIGLWLRWVYDNWLGEFDILTMFIPWFGYIGDRIASGEIPAWSPHYFGGAPVAGNPSGGWMYLQVMVLYAIFPILTATKMLLLTHAVISGAAIYGFCRKLTMAPPAALMSASIFVLGQILYGGTNYMTIATQASTWLVVGLLAAEMAMSARRMPALLGWSALLGIAISQMFVSWPGQGVAYGCIWIGGWMAYRLFFDPIPGLSDIRDRLWQIVLCGASAGFFALTFGAAGILPMLDFLSASTVPNGDYSQVQNGTYAEGTDGLVSIISMLMKGSTNFDFTVPSESFGATVMVLAVFGLFRARRQYGAIYFGIMFVLAMSLMVTYSPTYWIFEHIPVLGGIHHHRPSGVSWLVAIGPAMLAGAAVQKLIDADRPPLRLWHVTAMSGALALGLATVNSRLNWVGWWAWIAAFSAIAIYALPSVDLEDVARRFRPYLANRLALVIAALAIIMGFGYLWPGFWPVLAITAAAAIFLLTRDDLPGLARRCQPRLPVVVAYVLVGLVFLNPTGWDIYHTVQDPETLVGGWTDSPGKESESDWVIKTSMLRKDPGTAAEFLQQQEQLTGPFRYTGFAMNGEYDPRWSGTENESHKSGYSWRRMEPGVVGILVNARTYRLDLYQPGGYNPIQLRYWTEYVDVMNGRRQDYHWLDTFSTALGGSQLLDMLNVRYILVDLSIPDYRPAVQQIAETHTEVYRDDLVAVYENTSAFPHAWIVHNVEDNGNGYGLRMLASDNIDGHETAYVNTDGDIPSVESKVEGDVEFATLLTYDPEHIKLRASANSEGFLVMSDAYADGWNAYVDGKKTEIYRTNHALRGIVLPAGQHTVEFKYEPTSLQVGMILTGASSVAMVGIWAWALVDWRRRGPAVDGRVSEPSVNGEKPTVRSKGLTFWWQQVRQYIGRMASRKK